MLEGPSPSISDFDAESFGRICVLVMIACGIAGVLSLTVGLERILPSSDPKSLANLDGMIAEFSFSLVAVAGWLRSRYRSWRREERRPSGLPALNAESKKLPLWLLVFSLIVPLFAVIAILISIHVILIALGIDSTKSIDSDPWMTALGACTVLVTGTYAVLVAWHRHGPGRSSWIDAAVMLPALFAVLDSSWILVSRPGPILPFARSHPVSAVCVGVAVLVTSVFAIVRSHALRPRDKYGRAEEMSWFGQRKRHA